MPGLVTKVGEKSKPGFLADELGEPPSSWNFEVYPIPFERTFNLTNFTHLEAHDIHEVF